MLLHLEMKLYELLFIQTKLFFSPVGMNILLRIYFYLYNYSKLALPLRFYYSRIRASITVGFGLLLVNKGFIL